MSTGSTTLPESGPQDATVRRRWLPRLRDARIRSKLALILVVPLAAVLALATVRLVDVGSRAYDARQIERLTELGTNVSALTQNMQKERMAAARYLALPPASSAAKVAQDVYNAQVRQTDTMIESYTADRRSLEELPGGVQARLNRIDDHLRTMDATRKKVVDRDQIVVAEVVLRYGVVLTDLVGYGEVLGQFAGDGEVADGLRAVAAFSRAKAGTAEQEAVAFAARSAGELSEEQFSAFVATQTSQQEALLAFSLAADPVQRALVDSTVTGDAVTLADQVSTELSRSVNAPAQVSAQDASLAIGAVVDLMRWAELRLEAQLLDDANAESSSVTQQALIEAVLVLLTLVVAVVLAVILARSLNLSLRKLREGALSVANRDLPEAVARLRDVRNLGDGGADDIVRQVRDPIQLTNRDEVGQVAQAFNVVHREAVRIAAEQAALRTSVSAMFLNLARRSQSLVDRMIGELDQIERGEEDPKRLAQLFELDHLATRMRRNDENLLVLAGADSSAPRREDALLVDALRAAQSEVELYNRVEFGTVDTDISITALAVNDVVRLIAELLDNATRFSPPNTVVVADGRRIRDYVVIQVEDRGLGMSEEQMDGLNRRLAQPPGVDVAAFRLMGLAVVGRLASRYGVRVELRANIEGGTVAQVVLPSSIVSLSRSIEPARPSRPQQQIDSGPSGGGWGDNGSSGRTGTSTATLPAIAPEPWQQPRTDQSEDDRLIRATTTSMPTVTARPALPPVIPSQPTPDRPALPSRAPANQPAAASSPPLPTRQPAQERPEPPAELPSSIPAVFTNSAMGSPTVAYPTVPPSSLQAPSSVPVTPTVGFVTPDGKTIPAPSRPVSPNPSGWGAALAAMPPVPPPPVSAPVEDRADSPIFREMQASWFRAHDGTDVEEWSMPTAGYAPPPSPVPGSGADLPGGDLPARGTSFAGAESGGYGGSDSFASSGSGGFADSGSFAGSGSGGFGDDGRRSAEVPAPYVSPAVPAAASAYSAPAAPASYGTIPAQPGPGGSSGNGFSAPGSPGHGSSGNGSVNHGPSRPTSGGPGRPFDGSSDAGRVPADYGRGEGHGADGTGTGQNGDAPAGRDAESNTGGQSVPRPRKSAEEAWRTAADEGWHRAMAAAEPPDAGTTRSGLPKRVPQAQLVPGGVQTGPRDQARRTPDEVRGLLSAYHRGVQRGRTAGSAEAASISPAPKENEQ